MMIFIVKKGKLYLALLLVTLVSGCKDNLQQDVYTEYNPDKLFKTENGIKSTLYSGYGSLQGTRSTGGDFAPHMFPADQIYDWGGGFVNKATALINYTWGPQTSFFSDIYSQYYEAIRNSNVLLNNINKATSLTPDKVAKLKAEATFVRAASYYYLWDAFGPVPIIKSSNASNLSPSRPSEEKFNSFLEKEFQSAANNLPTTNEKGRATEGAALAFLGRFYLDQHKWEKAASINLQVIKLGRYKLYQGSIKNMFAVKNEKEAQIEIIFTKPVTVNDAYFNYQAYNYPPKYPVKSNQSNYGTQFTAYINFAKSYRQDDKRRSWFLFKYTDTDGEDHNLLNPNDEGRGPRCFKFPPDPNASGPRNGTDFPFIRYAEVLLNRAEALNEIKGQNQESVNLINKIRKRAGIPAYKLSDFNTKEEFRAAILKERGHEFVEEGLRRRDLIRQGKLIQRARARGATNAKDYMTRYPIPQSAIDVNPNLKQNPGY